MKKNIINYLFYRAFTWGEIHLGKNDDSAIANYATLTLGVIFFIIASIPCWFFAWSYFSEKSVLLELTALIFPLIGHPLFYFCLQ